MAVVSEANEKGVVIATEIVLEQRVRVPSKSQNERPGMAKIEQFRAQRLNVVRNDFDSPSNGRGPARKQARHTL